MPENEKNRTPNIEHSTSNIEFRSLEESAQPPAIRENRNPTEEKNYVRREKNELQSRIV